MAKGSNRMCYFAYGSNMSHKQMQVRCRGSKFITKATLKNYEFVFDGYSEKRKGAVANVIPEPGREVQGGLYEINSDHLNSLDRCEGYPVVYDREEWTVVDESGRTYTAWVYLRSDKQTGQPSDKYKEVIREGANDCSLPEEYINEILSK